MAIDQEIQQRVDTYRNNPQALQQRYAQNQQLLDLLALQRLKTEKDEAARKVQMEMAQNPQTIKQQREQQLLDMTKQDLAQQTQGIMQMAQQRQQKNMQQVAKQGAASPQQVQQVASGLGALAQRQAPQRMAAGGIVAFQAGGGVSQEMIEAYRAQLRQSNPRAAAIMSDARIREILSERAPASRANDPNYELTRRGYRRVMGAPIETAEFEEKEVQTTRPATTAAQDISATPTERDRVAADAEAAVAAPIMPTEESSAAPAPADGAPVAGGENAPAPAGGQTGAGGIMDLIQAEGNQLRAPNIDLSNVGNRGRDILAASGLGSLGDPEAARIRARDEAATYMGRDEKRQQMNQYLEELKAMDVRQQDPAKLRDERISAFLRGASGGSFGQIMAGGSGAMAEERAKQETSERERLLSRINLDKSAMDMDLSIAEKALTDGRSAFEQAMANRRQAASTLASTSNQDIQLAMKQAEMDFEANKGNIRNLLDAAQIQYTDDLRRAMEASDASQRAAQILVDLQKTKAEAFQTEAQNDRTLIATQAALAQNPDDPAARAAFTAAYQAVQNRVNAYFEGRLANGRSFNEIEDLVMQMARGNNLSLSDLGGAATQPTAPSFNLEGWGELNVR